MARFHISVIMGAMGLWNHPAYFDYVDRWIKEKAAKDSPFADAMWTAYRDKADGLGGETQKKLAAEPAVAATPDAAPPTSPSLAK